MTLATTKGHDMNTFGDLINAITAILPNATIEEDYEGQLVICTDLCIDTFAPDEALKTFSSADLEKI